MAREIGHVHIKTYDPEDGAVLHRQFRRDDEDEAPNGNIQLNLHGLQLNVTTISSAQNRSRSATVATSLSSKTPKVPRWR